MTALRNMSSLLRALHSSASPALRNADPRVPRSLFETLSRLPKDGVGSRVFQTRWQSKGIEGCYWEITRVKMKNGGKNGRAWGKLVWRGRPISEQEEFIRGGLKYKWSEGVSKGNNLKIFADTVEGSAPASTNAKVDVANLSKAS